MKSGNLFDCGDNGSLTSRLEFEQWRTHICVKTYLCLLDLQLSYTDWRLTQKTYSVVQVTS